MREYALFAAMRMQRWELQIPSVILVFGNILIKTIMHGLVQSVAFSITMGPMRWKSNLTQEIVMKTLAGAARQSAISIIYGMIYLIRSYGRTWVIRMLSLVQEGAAVMMNNPLKYTKPCAPIEAYAIPVVMPIRKMFGIAI